MKYYLAPMEGVTGRIFRNVYHACFPPMDKYFAPFITPNNNGRLSPRDYKELDRKQNQGLYVVPQILTNQADGLVLTAKTLKEMGYQEINLNLGCPSGTVVSKRRGAGFLGCPAELDHFLYDIISRTDIRISVKTRIGMEREEEFGKLLEIYNRYPLKELIIHPRIRTDYYKNTPRMKIFREGFVHSLNSVCYNGDIFTSADYEHLTAEYPALDKVMLGRGIAANPGLLQEFKTHRPMKKEQLFEFHGRLYHEYKEFLLPTSGERAVLFKMKEIWSYLIFLFPDSKRWEKKIKKAQSLSAYEEAVSSLFREGIFLYPAKEAGLPNETEGDFLCSYIQLSI